MSNIRFSPYNTADTAVSGAALNGLAASAYAYGPEIDNSTAGFKYADLALSLPSAVTAVSPANLMVFILPNVDGNYAASSGNPGPGYQEGVTPLSGGSVQFTQVRRIELPPGKFKVVIQNNLGVAFPASSAGTCGLYRYSETVT